MKYDVQGANALTNNKNTSLDFKIGDAAVIIDILRNRLYSDKIRVVVQEYLSNSRDAMREAGNTTDRIEVTLPTKKKPVLSIRDYGPGLSVERVGEVFVQFGKSTKRDSETQTGGFGLGGKSAFAYTDSYTVISIHNGIETHYVAHIGKNSVGSLDKVFEGKTDNKSGVEIQIGVNKTQDDENVSDIQRFNSMVYRTICFWNANELPVITNDHDADTCEWFHLHQKVKSEKGVYTDKAITIPNDGDHNNYYRSNSNELFLVIDGIIYELDESHKSDQLNTLLNTSSNSTVYLLLRAGLVEISASREAIAVNQQNKEVLNKAMVEAYKAIEKKVHKVINDADTIVKARKALELLKPIYGRVRDLKLSVEGITIDFGNGTIRDQGFKGMNVSDSRRRRNSVSNETVYLNAFFIHNDDDLADSTLETKIRALKESRGLKEFAILDKDLVKHAETLGATPVSSLRAERVKTEKREIPEGKVNLRVFDNHRDVTQYDHVDTNDTKGVTYVLVENVETKEEIAKYRALQTVFNEYATKDIRFAFPSKAAMKSVTDKENFVKKDEFFKDIKKYVGEFTKIVNHLKTLHVEKVKEEFDTLYEVLTKGEKIADGKLAKYAKTLSAIKIKEKTVRFHQNQNQSKLGLIIDALVKETFDKSLGEFAELPEFMEYAKQTYPLLEGLYYSEVKESEIVHYLNGKFTFLNTKAA